MRCPPLLPHSLRPPRGRCSARGCSFFQASRASQVPSPQETGLQARRQPCTSGSTHLPCLCSVRQKIMRHRAKLGAGSAPHSPSTSTTKPLKLAMVTKTSCPSSLQLSIISRDNRPGASIFTVHGSTHNPRTANTREATLQCLPSAFFMCVPARVLPFKLRVCTGTSHEDKGFS